MSHHISAQRHTDRWVVHLEGFEEAITGTMHLDLGSSRLSFSFDEPGQLVGAEFGLASTGLLDEQASVFARLALGPPADDLDVATTDRVDLIVETSDSWTPLGRLALMTTSIAETGQPFDGLWALEALGLLAKAGLPFDAGTPLLEPLIDMSTSVITHLSNDWLDSVDPRAASGLLDDVLTVGALDDAVLSSSLGRRALDGFVQEIESALDQNLELETSNRTSLGSGDPIRFQGVDDDLPRIAVLSQLDHTAEEIIESVSSILVGDEAVEIEVEPKIDHEALMPQVEARVFLDGLLVGAAIQLKEDAGVWTTRLTMPLDTAPEALRVVIGRSIGPHGLPLDSETLEAFVERQVGHHLRRTSDALRVGDERQAIDHLRRAEEALGGVVPLKAKSVGPFNTELATRSKGNRLEVQRLADDGQRRAARHLAWAGGDLIKAADMTLDILEGGGEPLAAPHVIRLMEALIEANRASDAVRLQTLSAEQVRPT